MRLRKCAGCRKPEATHTIAHNKGDLLVELDKEPYQVKVDIARAQVGVAKSNLIGAQAKDRQRVGHHQLPGSQCDHPADVRLAGDATRQAELLPGLDRGIHHCLCDVRNGLVSVENARLLYGVVIDHGSPVMTDIPISRERGISSEGSEASITRSDSDREALLQSRFTLATSSLSPLLWTRRNSA